MQNLTKSANRALYTNPCVQSSIWGDFTRLCRFLSTLSKNPVKASQVKNINFTIECPERRRLLLPSDHFYTTKAVDGLSEEDLTILNDVGETLGLQRFTSRTQVTLQGLRDAFYAMILVCTPDLRYLSIEVEPENHGRDMDIGWEPTFGHVASSYMDWLLDRILQHNQPLKRLAKLEEIKICSVIKRCGLLDQPKFIVGLLQFPTLRKFTTDVFIPENPNRMPNTSITSLNITNLIEEGNLLDKNFRNCHQLTNLAAAATKFISHVSDPMVLLPLSSTLTSLKLYNDRYASNSHYIKNYLSCLANLENLHISWHLLDCVTDMRPTAVKNLSVFDLEELMESGETLATSLSSSAVDPWHEFDFWLFSLKDSFEKKKKTPKPQDFTLRG